MIIKLLAWGRYGCVRPIFLTAVLLASGISRAEAQVWELAAEVAEPAAAPAALSTEGTASRRTAAASSMKLMPERYRLYRLDEAQLKQAMPAVVATTPGSDTRIIEVPFPGGEMVRLRLEKTDVLAPELGALHPEISTFSARGVDDPSIVGNLDLTPKGFHGLLLTPDG
ncbi:MAG: hypothetical protein ACR2QW_07575 [bacterium]